ncbi:MAG: ABC transporter ATP-binding protein, partial [Acidimicrobiales bacterium]
VRVRSPQVEQMRPALEAAGASLDQQGDGSWSIHGLSEDKVGEIAWQQHVLLYELAPRAASLEDAFIESTEGDIEFRGSGSGSPASQVGKGPNS